MADLITELKKINQEIADSYRQLAEQHAQRLEALNKKLDELAKEIATDDT